MFTPCPVAGGLLQHSIASRILSIAQSWSHVQPDWQAGANSRRSSGESRHAGAITRSSFYRLRRHVDHRRGWVQSILLAGGHGRSNLVAEGGQRISDLSASLTRWSSAKGLRRAAVSAKHSGGRASEEPLAFRQPVTVVHILSYLKWTAFSARTETEARAALAPPYANGLPAKAAMEAQADRASPSLRGLSRARSSGIRRSGLPRIAKRARGLFLLPHARARTKFGDCILVMARG